MAGGDRRSGGPRLVLLGPPNSGKGTQAKALAERLGVPAISTGEMLRRAVADGSELGRQVDSILNSGRLVDDETMAQVVSERLAQQDAAGGFLLDGYPRTDAQVATLEEILADRGEDLDGVVRLVVPEQTLLARARSRGRVDDDDEVIQERLRVYVEQTRPLVDHYRQRGLIYEIDGDRPVRDVTDAIVAALGGTTENGSAGAS